MNKLLPTFPALALCAAAGLCAVAIQLPAQDIGAPPDVDALSDREGSDAWQATTRGPMHEAFANPYVTDPQPGIIVDQQPPEPINEVPPDEMPEGDHVVWISGYWGWDPDAQEFLWISGLWRNVPGDERWVPGYWAEVADGYQWVPGFWSSGSVNQLTYLPEPPASLEQGPNIGPPDGDFFWVPGCWIWESADFQWRPGYWAPTIVDWIWIPDQYVWTPYGCVFVPGYWDFDVLHRGVMFAPVVFQQPVYQQPNYSYTPNVVINTAPLLLHLFVSPGYSHYFYGDYYGYQPNNNFGFLPWYSYGRQRNYYDPLLTYYQWSYAQRNVNLIQRLSSWNGYFVQNQSFRPPRTFAAQRQFAQRLGNTNASIQPATLMLASSLSSVVKSNDRPFQFTRVADPQRQRFTQRAQSMRQFQQQRRQFEISDSGGAATRAGGRNRAGNNDQPGTAAPRVPAERKLDLPESIAAAPPASPAPGEKNPETDGAPGQQNRDRANRRRPPEPPKPGQADGRGSDRGPGGDRREGNRPGRDVSEGSRPERNPGARNRPEQSKPEDQSPMPRPDVNPAQGDSSATNPQGADRPSPRGTAGERPNADRPGRNRPGAPGAADDEGPEIPRFGVARNREPQPNDGADDTAGAAPANANPNRGPDASPDGGERRRGLGRGGFDPFGGLPPGAGGAADSNAEQPAQNIPRPGANPGAAGRRERPQPTPGTARPDAGPGRNRPELPEGAPTRPPRGEAARPGRGNAERPNRGANPAAPRAASGPRPSAGAPPSAARPSAGAPPSAAAPSASPPPAGAPPAGGPPVGNAKPRRNPEGGGPKPPAGGGPPPKKDRDKGKKPKG